MRPGLLRADAADHGAEVVEGYPVEPKTGRLPNAFARTGLPSACRAPTRPIMRLEIARPVGS